MKFLKYVQINNTLKRSKLVLLKNETLDRRKHLRKDQKSPTEDKSDCFINT